MNRPLPGDRLTSPAAARNKVPILEVLRCVLPATGSVLEVASGTGEHAAFLAAELPSLSWQPSDPDPAARASISAWAAHLGSPENLRPPLALDAAGDDWPIAAADAVVCVNMIHISPWASCRGLMRGAARILPHGGILYLYGPYRVGGLHTAPSNEAFDRGLQSQDPSWGVRDLEAVAAEAEKNGLILIETVPMPANNLSVVFRKN